MKRLLIVVLLLTTSPLLALETNCSALGELYAVRAMMMKKYSSSYDIDRFVDRRLDALRDPLPGGGYRWVHWVRPEGEAPIDKKLHRVRAARTALDSFEASGDHTFAVRVVVPSKRTLFSGNSPVFVGNVEIRYTADGKTRTISQQINATMQPDTSRTIDLPVIADHADVRLQSGTDNPGESLVEVHFRQAVAEDDPDNPSYPAIRALRRIRGSADARTVDDEIAAAERSVFAGSDPLPLLSIVEDLRRADDLMRSKKEEDHERGDKLLKETLRRLR